MVLPSHTTHSFFAWWYVFRMVFDQNGMGLFIIILSNHICRIHIFRGKIYQWEELTWPGLFLIFKLCKNVRIYFSTKLLLLDAKMKLRRHGLSIYILYDGSSTRISHYKYRKFGNVLLHKLERAKAVGRNCSFQLVALSLFFSVLYRFHQNEAVMVIFRFSLPPRSSKEWVPPEILVGF